MWMLSRIPKMYRAFDGFHSDLWCPRCVCEAISSSSVTSSGRGGLLTSAVGLYRFSTTVPRLPVSLCVLRNSLYCCAGDNTGAPSPRARGIDHASPLCSWLESAPSKPTSLATSFRFFFFVRIRALSSSSEWAAATSLPAAGALLAAVDGAIVVRPPVVSCRMARREIGATAVRPGYVSRAASDRCGFKLTMPHSSILQNHDVCRVVAGWLIMAGGNFGQELST